MTSTSGKLTAAMKKYLFLLLVLPLSFSYGGESQTDQADAEKQESEEVTWVIDAIVGEPEVDNYVMGPEFIPDLRKADLNLKLQKGDFVVVPIPISNPTLGSGLVIGSAYFYPQSAAQAKLQPPSVTGAVAFKSSSESTAFGVGHQSYFGGNKWRLGGVYGRADLELALNAPAAGNQRSSTNIDWRVRGNFLAGKVTRKIAGKWYAGVLARYLDMTQTFSVEIDDAEFSLDSAAKSAGLGFTVEYDDRDKPMNSYSGRIFEIDVFSNTSAFGSDNSYQSYSFKYRSYHRLASSLVLAWEAQACARSDKAPLWDACRISLRGFSAIDYLGKTSTSAQIEARWRFHRKWGAVAFAGGGMIKNQFTELSDRQVIPSYGIGLRFMVLESQRINLRLDYARSVDSDAFYVSVGEAF